MGILSIIQLVAGVVMIYSGIQTGDKTYIFFGVMSITLSIFWRSDL